MTEAVNDGMDRAEIRSLLPNAWEAHRGSAFIRYIQDWPRGYRGDFEAINMIMDSAEWATETSLSGALGRVVLESPIAQQHREKIRIQAGAIERMCRRFDGAKILSIACGPSRDLELVMSTIEETGARAFLIDSDSDAIEESKARLSPIWDRVTAVRAEIQKITKAVRSMDCGGGGSSILFTQADFSIIYRTSLRWPSLNAWLS